jgi:hypothetical protein
MAARRLPVRPDLEQLHRQAKELLRAMHVGDANAIAQLREHRTGSIDPSSAKLADAQLRPSCGRFIVSIQDDDVRFDSSMNESKQPQHYGLGACASAWKGWAANST